jgi:hypothetical protein
MKIMSESGDDGISMGLSADMATASRLRCGVIPRSLGG